MRRNTEEFGNAFAGRGTSINEAVGELPRLFGLLYPVTRNLADPRTQIGRFFRELGDAARVVSPIADLQADLFTRGANTFEAISRDTDALKETISRSHPLFRAGVESFPVQRPFLTESARLAREMRPVARELRPTLPLINPALARGIPVTRRSVGFYGDLKPTLTSLRDLATDPASGIALRALGGTSRTLQPQLKFLGPFQTVCNYWNYWWTFLSEHLAAESGQGLSQRSESKSAAPQTNNPGSMGAWEPVNGEGYQRGHGAPRLELPPALDALQPRDHRRRRGRLRERPARVPPPLDHRSPSRASCSRPGPTSRASRGRPTRAARASRRARRSAASRSERGTSHTP